LTSCVFSVAMMLLRTQQSRAAPWFTAQEGTVSARYRVIENSAGVRTTDQLQDKLTFRGRLDPWRTDRLTVDVGAFSGASFTSSWNNTGLGTGAPAFALSVKQLFVSARPWAILEAQVGSLYAVRGETTEITNYDNDVYLTGERLVVRDPRRLFVDSITVTRAFLGDFSTPNAFRRLDRLAEANFAQVLVEKTLAPDAVVSVEWSQPPEGETIRSGVRLPLPRVRTAVRFETYWRVPDHAGGVGLTVDHPIGHHAEVGGGFSSIDRLFPPINGDRYANGHRVFAQASFSLTRTLSASVFFTQAFSTPYALNTARRFDALVTYNVLRAVTDALRGQSSTVR
jgi:hypothetical protein